MPPAVAEDEFYLQTAGFPFTIRNKKFFLCYHRLHPQLIVYSFSKPILLPMEVAAISHKPARAIAHKFSYVFNSNIENIINELRTNFEEKFLLSVTRQSVAKSPSIFRIQSLSKTALCPSAKRAKWRCGMSFTISSLCREVLVWEGGIG